MKPDELDAALNSEVQMKIRETVRALPEEALSLAWRSELNERLLKAKSTPWWKLRLSQGWKPAVALGLASCLGLIVGLRTFTRTAPDHSAFEASLVNAYNDSTRLEDLAGTGLGVHEVGDVTRTSDSSVDWTESDLNAL